VFLTYTVQEMAMRLGVVADKGYTHLIRERYGRGWMFFQLIALVIENLITLITEFIGMSAGMVIIGLPMWLAVLISLMLVASLVLVGGYNTKERMALIIGMFNIVFIIVDFLTKPDLSAVGKAFLYWTVPPQDKNDIIWYTIALIGNAIAPWMIFYQNGAYADKDIKTAGIRRGRMDTLIGCICQVLAAVFVIIIGASLFGVLPNLEQAGPAQLIEELGSRFGFAAALLFGLGLFNSGLLAAITVSLSSSWSVAEAFGWSKSLNDRVSEAPKFYAFYFASVCLAAGAVLIPNLPLNHLSVLAQVLGGVLMTPVLIFLTLLSSSREVMGEYRNSRRVSIRAWVVAAVLSAVSLLTVWNVAFCGHSV
jgi:Mn2+/Fe2+ NRAMP family transporter